MTENARRGLGQRESGIRGQSVVELGLLLPILTILMLGALDFGRAYYFYAGVTNAARVGAQYAMNPEVSDGDVKAAVMKEAQPYVMLTADKITYSYPDGKYPSKEFSVRVVFDYTFLVPLASRIWGSAIQMNCISFSRYE